MTKKDYFDWEAVKVKSSFSKKYVSLAEAIEKGCNDLGTLFRLWQIAQMCETDPKSSSFPNLSLAKCSDLTFSNTFASSFCPDGFLKKEETLKKKSEEKSDGAPGVPILFICRESNISGCIKEGPKKDTKEIVGNIGQEKRYWESAGESKFSMSPLEEICIRIWRKRAGSAIISMICIR